MKWLNCMILLQFTSGSCWVHVIVLDSICTDGRPTGKRDGMYILSKCDRYSIRGGNMSPAVEKIGRRISENKE